MRRRRIEQALVEPSSDVRVGQLVLQTDLTPATWIADRVHEGRDLASFVPQGFDAYARVFHPAYRWESNLLIPDRWADVAVSSGTTAHPGMLWGQIAGERRLTGAPSEGSLPKDLAAHLSNILAAYTSSPDVVWFAVWEGWAGLRFLPDDSSSQMLRRVRFLHLSRLRFRLRFRFRLHHKPKPPAPRFQMPHGRNHYLLKGPIGAATETFGRFWQSANLWWPDDHAWFVATEIDSQSTYVGGTRACIEAILADPELEAHPVDIEDRVGWGTDTTNPPLLDHDT